MKLKDFILIISIIAVGILSFLIRIDDSIPLKEYDKIMNKYDSKIDSIKELNLQLHIRDGTLVKRIESLKLSLDSLDSVKQKVIHIYHERIINVDNANIYQLDSIIRTNSSINNK